MNVKNPDTGELKKLIAGCDDEASHHILWIDKSGGVHITAMAEGQSPLGFQKSKPEMRFRFKTYSRGNGHVGSQAASDSEYVQELLNSLTKTWLSASNSSDVEYVDFS